MAKKIYDVKVDRVNLTFSVWDREEQVWMDLPKYCSFYTSIDSTFYTGLYGQRKNQPISGNKKCKASDYPTLAGKEWVRTHLHGSTGVGAFFRVPFRRNK